MGLGLAPPPFSPSVATTITPGPAYAPCPTSSLLLHRRHHHHHTSRRCSLRTRIGPSQSPRMKPCGAIGGQVQAEDSDPADEEACELVNGTGLTIGDDTHTIHAHLFQAVKNNNGTGILLLSDIFGFQDSSTRDFAYRIACNGYNVLVPDLFRGDPWRKDRPESALEAWLATQEPGRVAKDIHTSTKWMVDEFLGGGISQRLGVIGFCYGGGRVLEVLSRDRDDSFFGAGVSFYGTRMDKSAATGGGVKVPILFVAGDKDPLCPASALSELAEIVGNGSKAVVYEGRGHGFAHRPQSSEEDADAEAAFLAMRNWLHHHLVETR